MGMLIDDLMVRFEKISKDESIDTKEMVTFIELLDEAVQYADQNRDVADKRGQVLEKLVKKLCDRSPIDADTGIKPIDELRHVVLTPNVSYSDVVHQQRFRCPTINYQYTSDAIKGAGSSKSRNRLPYLHVDWLGFLAVPSLQQADMNSFEWLVMNIPVLRSVMILPEVWGVMQPTLRLFVLHGRTKFRSRYAGKDVINALDMDSEALVRSPTLCTVGHVIRMLVVLTFYDALGLWDIDPHRPPVIASGAMTDGGSYDKRVRALTKPVYFSLMRVFTMYKTVFWRCLYNHYYDDPQGNAAALSALEPSNFDPMAISTFRRWEWIFGWLDVNSVSAEAAVQAVHKIEQSYCYKGSNGEAEQQGSSSSSSEVGEYGDFGSWD
ncbi:hypothetical protein Pmar_PMAR005693 [Perkinsus marinus ATCC 50983]|uniref:Uncharacterized protein n=1 Tax=Perkinsus marinus (strain ATCC 50983 / TXsc) TaxID=423536 RepID=C5L3E8_PERM5|nr:hypothetical protein Pmar_PMAR005693 [Perkinsus marinus ATCC 50983]EER08746.1 hypothetical protein Pmar_PMAR005693 [Perkinsus marinus ATCC 50983]|eukprot:XP_002776930.1 hypothetical protein Pmar_PMAR005693 [Perkinsus marinus ATCC 50983]